MNLRLFKHYRVYLELLNSSNVGGFSTFLRVEFLGVLSMFKERKENLSSYVHVLHKMSHWEVSRRSRAVDVKEMY